MNPKNPSVGHMPADWKPRVAVLRCSDGGSGRWIELKVGGSHLSLPDGTRIEPMQVHMPIENLDFLIASLQEAREWTAVPEAIECD